MPLDPRMRELTIMGQDPSVKGTDGKILRAKVSIPLEKLQPGPRGYRVGIIDYDSTLGKFHGAYKMEPGKDEFEGKSDGDVLEDYGCHAQNSYAIVMRVLARMEFALGRRIPWGFSGHQLYVAPHAMQDANAFYSEQSHGIFLGYIKRGNKTIYTCLSHDVIAHESAHAILDGLRDHLSEPSLKDQAAFHEGFSDIVALLSVFSLPEVVEALLRAKFKKPVAKAFTADQLKRTELLMLGEQMGRDLNPDEPRKEALRMFAGDPDPGLLAKARYDEPHLRGEILVSAVLDAFARIWARRLEDLSLPLPPGRVAEEGEAAAEHLLNITIRALDYCPPVDLTLGDYLSAILTADLELVPDDRKYGYREKLLEAFGAWGIRSASNNVELEREGAWRTPDLPRRHEDPASPRKVLSYADVHFDMLKRDPDEVFRFLWENRKELGICEDCYTRINWVRPCTRTGPDGFVLHETLVEYIQEIDIRARDLGTLELERPAGMPDDALIRLLGGGTLIFDEFGRLKYHVHKNVIDRERQQEKINYWWGSDTAERGARYGFPRGKSSSGNLAAVHRLRFGGLSREAGR